MRVTIIPEPSDPEREAILAALAATGQEHDAAWAGAALAEGVDGNEPEP